MPKKKKEAAAVVVQNMDREGDAMPIPILHDNLTGNQAAAKVQLTLSKQQAAYYMWKNSLLTEAKRGEIAKCGSISYLLTLLDKGPLEGKYFSAGALQNFVGNEEYRTIIAGHTTGSRNILNLADLIDGEHERTKLSAAICLHTIACAGELVHRCIAIIPQVVDGMRMKEPQWAHMHLVRAYCSGIIRVIAEVDTMPESLSFREGAGNYHAKLLEHGILPTLIELLTDVTQEARANAALALCAILEADRSLNDEVIASGAIPVLVELASSGNDDGRAGAAGCLKCLALTRDAVLKILEADGVPPLVRLLTPPLPAEDPGKKKKRKKKAPPLPPAILKAIIHTTGALRLLSFEDEAKPLIGQELPPEPALPAIPALAKLIEMKGKKWNLNFDAYQSAVGTLYNLSHDPTNLSALVEAKIPQYLLSPFPAGWMADMEYIRPATAPGAGTGEAEQEGDVVDFGMTQSVQSMELDGTPLRAPGTPGMITEQRPTTAM